MSSGRAQSGFTYLCALLFVAATGAALGAAGEAWSHARQREKEAELIWIGNQFKQAIALYYQRSPGTIKRYPGMLEDLLEDHRFVTTQRYLRRLYTDPITGKAEWGLVSAPTGGIMGVYSLSKQASLRPGTKYDEWRFVYEPLFTARR